MIASTQTNHPLADCLTSANNEELLQAACEALRQVGLRVTQPRVAILKSLIRTRQPMSIEQLHVKGAPDPCDLVTVYRCLAAFEEAGLVQRSFLQNGTSLFQLIAAEGPSYNVISKDCGSIQGLPESVQARLREAVGEATQVLAEQGYSDISHVVEFFARQAPIGSRRDEGERVATEAQAKT